MGSKDATNIDIFLRLRPAKKNDGKLIVPDYAENKVEFNVPRHLATGPNNQKEHYNFRFNSVIGPEAKQDEVFERVARTTVSGAMEGFNGTIFAYGQTGSGKTFTITGGPERYVDRGIIPRSISAIFGEIAKRGDYQYQVHISYLEIYNDTGYDLLDPGREVSAMEDLRQVKVMVDDEEGGVRFHNLEKHPAATEEDALNLLFLGDTNRTISETPMNMASSRSHCIFTIYVEARKGGEDTVRRSKLNLVDLAGSERVSKTGVDGTTLAEAKYINLSLHYLEQVIIALQERSMGMHRPHIPYRNSMMTTALKDSLGGNCRTVMVATASSDPSQILESISTCRFAVRVAMVSNKVELNEEVDPTIIIRRLKQEVRDLKDELRMLKGEGDERGPLTPDELLRLRDQVEAFVAEHGPEANLNLAGSMMFIKAAFDTFKTIINEGGGVKGGPGVPAIMGSAGTPKGGEGGGSGPMSADVAEQIKKLKLQVQQRDNEINILVSMLKRREAKGGPVLSGSVTSLPGTGGGPGGPPQGGPEGGGSGGSGGGGSGGGGGDDISALFNTNMLADRNKAFELFRKSYRQNEVIEENKLLLKQKYDSAKTLGQSVNESKQRINDLKTLIEQRRVQRSVAGGPDGEMEDDHEELQYKAQIEQEKNRYKDSFNSLRDHKREIEHLHMMLEQSRVRLQRDFEQWLGLMSRQGAAGGGPPGGPLPGANGGGPGMGGPSSSSSSPASRSMPVASPLLRSSHESQGGTPPRGQGPPRQAWGESTPVNGSVSSSRGGGGGGPSAGPSPSQSMASPGLMASAAAQRRMQDAFQNVDPQVLELARPHFTGNPEADQDILKFYEAKSKLMAQMRG